MSEIRWSSDALATLVNTSRGGRNIDAAYGRWADAVVIETVAADIAQGGVVDADE
jgi:hypothetical protein